MDLRNYYSTFTSTEKSPPRKRPEPDNEQKIANSKKRLLKSLSKEPRKKSSSADTEPLAPPSQSAPHTPARRPSAKSPAPRPIKAAKAPAASGPLAKTTFVITGVLSSYSREGLTDHLKSLGARVTGSVSTRTHYLIHGEELEDGRNSSEGQKYKKALSLKVKILNESQLEDLLGPLGPESPRDLPQLDLSPLPPDRILGNVPWTEKYRPMAINEIIGNAPVVEKLRNWLKDWENVVLHGQKKELRKFDPQSNLNARAVLLSGPPGIGKTTTARVVARSLGFHAAETNASDVRNKKALAVPLQGASVSRSLVPVGGALTVAPQVLIMDEVDGMSAGDRGGVSAIIELIKASTVPMICICNDRMSSKVRSLAASCYDLRFTRPNKAQVIKRLLNILARENVSIEPNALEAVLSAAGSDIRQTLTFLELWARTNTSLNYYDAKKSAASNGKDALKMVSNFEAAGKLLNSRELRTLSHRNRLDLFFIDMDLVPLLVQENYLTAIYEDKDCVLKMDQAAESIAFSDVINKKIRGNGEWSLLPSFAMASSVEPGLRSGNGVPFPKFPEWLGKFSTRRKKERLLGELRTALLGRASGDNEALLNEFLPLIYLFVIDALEAEDAEAAAGVLYYYGLSPELLKEHMTELQVDSLFTDNQFRDLPSKTRTALTRYYNSHFTSSIVKAKKQKKAGTTNDGFDPDIEEPKVEEQEQEEEEFAVKPKIKKKRGKVKK